ncbi:putative tetratricopeptide repeat protein 41 isoform X1 [Mirounga angustirostris]|uniref:putative tetratricopeptide repeat protein 41 isoform X1 n=1 Tax=Mirounga angustirostris TaxID=9716 RepID=UPI00156C294B|nr:putative tetratricopeptide repeat protein 41 [Mirounga leonina]XP_045728682.1 putative tetratricopeptide repeat protein 41 isoform X1 [Mirounga angustirostris]
MMSSPEQSEISQKANVDRYAQFVLKFQKPIQPYICSTLNDFQEDRDFLANYIFPQLNELCNSRGTYFKAVDLRWPALMAPPPLSSNLFRQHSCLHSQYLKLCLDYVNTCFPFFICMLGQTYGDFLPEHVPLLFSKATDLSSLSTVEQNLYVAAKNGYPWVLESPNYSLTELEIIQAAFLNESQFQYFYFRTGTTLLKTLDEEKERLSSGSLNDEEKLKIGKLKAKIISKGLPVRFYKDLHELGELVFKDWSVVIEQLYPATLMIENMDYKHNFERFYHEEFTEKCKQVFVISKESSRTFEILERFALKDVGFDFNSAAAGSSLDSILRINPLPVYKSILLLSGERGCGKSTLIANWVNYFKKKYPSMLMIPHFVGSTCESSDIMSVIHYFITELQYKNYGSQLETDLLNEDSNALVFPLLVEVFIASISLKPCILVLDGIEELIGIYGISGQKVKDFSWLPCLLPPHCKFIMSTVSSSLSYKSLCARPDVRTVELLSVGDEEVKLNIFQQYLFIPNKDPLRQSKHTLRKRTHLNPLKLTILANELRECRIYRDEYQCLKEYLEVVSIQELWELVLKRWIEDYSWTFIPKRANSDTMASGEVLDGWVVDALCLLSISHCGLTEDEIFQILDMLGYRDHYKVTTLHWAAFRNATRHWVQEKPNGLLHFRHQSLRNAVEHKLLGVLTPVRESSPYTFQNPTNHRKTHFHRVLVCFFQRQTAFWRVYEELPWHMKMSGSWGDLCSFLSSPSITDFISKIQNPSFWTRLHLIHYWNVLAEVGYDAAGAYLFTVAKIKADKCHKVKKRHTLSVLECRLFEVTTTDKCRLIFFIAKLLKLMGKTREAEELFLSVENMLVQSQSLTEMLLKVQNTTGELYLEIGMTQEGFQYFQKAWSNLVDFSPSNMKDNQDFVKQKGRVLNNLAKSATEKYLKENHILECAAEISSLLDNSPRDQATMKYTEGVLMFVAGNTSLARMRFQECLTIRRSLFGEKNILVGEIMEFLADLLFFLPGDSERFQKKQAIEYYKQVIQIKENAGTFTNSSLVRKQLSISLSDTLCKLAGQLLISDSGHHVMTEAVDYLYRSLDLRATYLGSSHSSIHGILQLLREIEWIRSRRCWPQGISRQYSEGSRNGTSLWEHLLKLNYHSAQSSNTVSSAICMNADKLQRAKSMDLESHTISDKSKYASGKGKKVLRPIISVSIEEKTPRKTQNNVELWNGPEKEASLKKQDYSSKILSLGKMDGVVKLSRHRILSAKGKSEKGQITTIYRHPLVIGSLSTNNPWESISELISEKWFFHSPDYSSISQKSFFERRPPFETKLLKTSNDTNKV